MPLRSCKADFLLQNVDKKLPTSCLKVLDSPLAFQVTDIDVELLEFDLKSLGPVKKFMNSWNSSKNYSPTEYPRDKNGVISRIGHVQQRNRLLTLGLGASPLPAEPPWTWPYPFISTIYTIKFSVPPPSPK